MEKLLISNRWIERGSDKTRRYFENLQYPDHVISITKTGDDWSHTDFFGKSMVSMKGNRENLSIHLSRYPNV